MELLWLFVCLARSFDKYFICLGFSQGDYDLTLFPFDTQRCAIKLESWRYTAIYMTFRFGNNVTIKQWSENEQWELVSTSQAKIGLTYLDPGNSFDRK